MLHSVPISKSRVEALSDGVYAVALTLLALDLKLPAANEAGTSLSGDVLTGLLAALTPKALVWFLSFWVASLFWLSQNRMLQLYREMDRPGLLVELMQLALITLLPFSTALIGEHGNLALAAFVYATHLTLLALLSLVRIQRLRSQARLRVPGFDADAVQFQWRRASALLAWLLLAMALAFVVPGWNMLALLGVLVHRRA